MHITSIIPILISVSIVCIVCNLSLIVLPYTVPHNTRPSKFREYTEFNAKTFSRIHDTSHTFLCGVSGQCIFLPTDVNMKPSHHCSAFVGGLSPHASKFLPVLWGLPVSQCHPGLQNVIQAVQQKLEFTVTIPAELYWLNSVLEGQLSRYCDISIQQQFIAVNALPPRLSGLRDDCTREFL